MPQETSHSSIQEVLNKLNQIPKEQPNVIKSDVQFLKYMMDCPVVQSLALAHDTLGHSGLASPERGDAVRLVTDFLSIEQDDNDSTIEELSVILQKPFLQSLLAAHDTIAEQRRLEQLFAAQTQQSERRTSATSAFKNAIRIIGLTKRPNEAMGLMVAEVNHQVVVTRVIHGGLIHKQGLLNVGDVIKEVNGKPVKGDPEVLKDYFSKPNTSFILKVIPSLVKSISKDPIYMRCNFTYDASKDTEVPGKDVGLSFNMHDVLEIVDRRDIRWWQARHVSGTGEPSGRAGLIPSPQFQDRRVASGIESETRKSVSEMYKFSNFSKFDEQCSHYEEVTRMPAFSRKVVAVISDDKSVGSKLKLKLPELFKGVYKVPVTHTSNASLKSDCLYSVVEKADILNAIKNNDYFEYTSSADHIYGVKYDSIRNVIKAKKVCVINMASKNLKFVMNSEFMPFVIHLKDTTLSGQSSPDNDIPTYAHMVNLTLPFTNLGETCQKVHQHLQESNSQAQWLPISWVY